MSQRDEIQQVVDEAAKARGYSKVRGSWYRRQAETVAVLNLQRSQYSHAYYLNVALWFLALGEATAPKEHECHIRTRGAELVDNPDALTRALDLECPEDPDRRRLIVDAAIAHSASLLAACRTLAGCLELPGRTFVDRSLVRAEAQKLLAGES